MTALTYNSTLPWSGTDQEERRFERILYSLLIPMLVLAVAIPLLPLFKLALEQIEEPPPVPVKLLVQPPRPIVQPAAAPVPKPEPAPAEPKPQVKPAPAPIPAPNPEATRERAARRLTAVTRELSSLRDNQVITATDSQRQLSGPVAASNTTTANLSALRANQNSGGISTSGIGASGNGTTLADYAPTTGGTGAGSTGAGSAGGGGAGRRGAYQPQRSKESIQIIFDRNKAAFDTLYQRALRQTADLRGVLTLEITILPSGQVAACRVLASELHDADLEAKVVSRVQLLNFGAEDVPTVKATFPLRFFPS